jgi:hypothetical protein
MGVRSTAPERLPHLRWVLTQSAYCPLRAAAARPMLDTELPGARSASVMRWADSMSFQGEYSRQVPGTPLSSCSPRSSKVMPEPATRSTTVLVTRTSLGSADEQTRSARCTAIPVRSSPCSSTRRRGGRLEPQGRGHGLRPGATAQAMARRGPSTVARVPSPVLLTCRPRNRSS